MSTYTNEIGQDMGLGQGRWWALVALALTGLVIALDTTVLVTALPTLSTKLGATTDELQWITPRLYACSGRSTTARRSAR